MWSVYFWLRPNGRAVFSVRQTCGFLFSLHDFQAAIAVRLVSRNLSAVAIIWVPRLVRR